MSLTPHARHSSLCAATAIAVTLALGTPDCVHAAATIVVDTIVDEDASNTDCSLREAIVAANMNANYNGCTAGGAGVNDTIVFDIDPPKIEIGSTSLPPITEAVIIDGDQDRVELNGPSGAARVPGKHGLIVNSGGSGTTIRNLVVNNFDDDGIYIDANNVSVLGCFIGTDAGGMAAAPNKGFGVHVFRGSGARIGGTKPGAPCTGDCNLISGAIGFNANVFFDDNASDAVVSGNFIGTDITGAAAIPNNALEGVRNRGDGNRIGGTTGTSPGGSCTGECNLISGNKTRGIRVDGPASDTVVLGNFIGTDVTGTKAVSNSLGIETYPTLVIGGTTAAARNLISANNTGVLVRGVAPVVQGNYIGPSSDGSAAVPGTFTAIIVYQAAGAKIGGSMAGAGNLVSGTRIAVRIDHSTNTEVLGNRFGTKADGSTPLPNGTAFLIHEAASNNIVGGLAAGAANVIAFSENDGVLLDGTTPPVRGNAIRGNSIHSSAGRGIYLRTNPNDNLPPPTILGIGPLHGTACAQCEVDIYSDSADEGRVFEGSVFTNDGNWTFNGPLTGPNVTATNTDMSSNTSEFSAPFSLASPTPTASPTSSLTASPSRTPTSTRTASVTATGMPSQTATGAPTGTRTATRTPTASRTATGAPSQTATGAATGTRSATRTRTSTATAAPPSTATSTSQSTASASPSTATSTPPASPTPMQSATATGTPGGLATPSATPSAAPSPSPTPSIQTGATPTATPPAVCVGDCDGNSTVSIGELITLVNIILDRAEPEACAQGIPDGATVNIALIIQAVNNALNGCA